MSDLLRGWPVSEQSRTPVGWAWPQNLMPHGVGGWPRGRQPSCRAEEIAASAVGWWDARLSGFRAGDRWVRNLGVGGDVLNARMGSSTLPNTNDPVYLDYAGTPYVYLPGVAGNYLSVPDEAALRVTGDIDIRVRVALDDWTPGAFAALLTKHISPTNYGYGLWVNATGNLYFEWSATGAAALSATSSVATGVTDGSVKWVRVTLDVDNGAAGRDVKFYTSDDGATWTQLGTTQTSAGVTSIFASTQTLYVGALGSTSNMLTAKVYRAQVLNGIDGTTVLDIDTSVLTSGAATSFTALTGQTVTVNRSTSGRKSVAVVSPCWLFGTDDYMEVADNDLLDFGAGGSFTALVVARQPSYTATQVMLAKGASATTVGYVIRNQTGTPAVSTHFIHDGSTSTVASGPTRTAGVLHTSVTVRGVGADTVTGYGNAVAGTPVTDTTTATLANAEALRIGRYSGAGTNYMDMEFVAAAVFRRALSVAEVTTLSDYYQLRG